MSLYSAPPPARLAFTRSPFYARSPRPRHQVKSRASRTVTRAASKPKPGINGVPYVAANRFVIPDSDPAVVARFEEEMRRRETLMASLPGFTHCGLTKDGAHEYTFAQEWATKQAGASGFTAKGLRCWAGLRVWALG